MPENRGQRRGARTAGLVVLVAALLLPSDVVVQGQQDQRRARERARMIEEQIRARGVQDEAVLEAMRSVPRHLLVPEDVRPEAYGDHPLPIGYRQTISQPYIVALMTELLEIDNESRVLEIGTGSGYQAAVLAEIAAEVFTIEIVEELAARASSDLESLGYGDIAVRAGDGYRGWPEEAPFDAVILTAAPPEIPRPLLEQLRIGGRLVAPVGDDRQELYVIRRTESGFDRRRVLSVRFVPMTGRVREP